MAAEVAVEGNRYVEELFVAATKADTLFQLRLRNLPQHHKQMRLGHTQLNADGVVLWSIFILTGMVTLFCLTALAGRGKFTHVGMSTKKTRKR